MNLELLRNIILIIGWPVLIILSIYVFIQGKKTYQLVRDSLIGKITKVLVFTMLIEMYSLGIVCTFYMYADAVGVYVVLPVFIIWFISFIWTIKILNKSSKEAQKISQN